LPDGHFGVKLEEFFEAIGVVFEAAIDVDAIEYFVIGILRLELV
jgi:hypothetical protein